MIKAIFFDNDGVLADSEKLFFRATREILAGANIELTTEKFIELTLIDNKGGWKLARDKNFSEAQIDELRTQRNILYEDYLYSENILIDSVEMTIKYLHGKYKLGIVTSSKKLHFDIIHKRMDILKYFDFVLTREDYVKSKPDPEPYLKAVEISGFSKEDCVVVEDSQRGLEAAYEAGLKCIIIPNEFTINSDFTKAWKVLNSISELKDILKT